MQELPFLQRVGYESIETAARTRRLLWAGAMTRMGDHRLPKRTMSGKLYATVWYGMVWYGSVRGGGGGGTERKDGRAVWHMASECSRSGVIGGSPHQNPGRGMCHSERRGKSRFMTAWKRGRKKEKGRPPKAVKGGGCEKRKRMRKREDADKVEA